MIGGNGGDVATHKFQHLQHSLEVLLLVTPFVLLSLLLREAVKAHVAARLGDPTARQAGHASFDPRQVIDPIGLGAFALSWAAVSFPFGWARPMPVTPWRFRNPPRAMALVAASGILVNLVLAVGVEALLVHEWFPADSDGVVLDALTGWFLVSLGLSVFQLLPVPPLDGSRIVGGFLDRNRWNRWVEFDQYGPVVLLVLFLVFNQDMTQILNSMASGLQRAFAPIVGG